MTAEQIREHLVSPTAAQPLLDGWQLRDTDRGFRNLTALSRTLGLDRLRDLCGPLSRYLPRSADPDMALNNLERLLAAADETVRAGLLDGRAKLLEAALAVVGTSQFFADLLATNPDFLDLLRPGSRRAPTTSELAAQLRGEVDAARDDAGVLREFRRFRHRQILRIGVGDTLRDRTLEDVAADLSRVADASLQIALETAHRTVAARFGEPHTASGVPARLAVLAFGKLGGEELNYSSDIDLLFVYDEDGTTHGGRCAALDNADFFARVVTEVVRLLSAHTDRGQAYRVDLRLRPDGQRGPLARSLAGTLSYYDTRGRTWERQALIKLRCVAGDSALGDEFLRAIEAFVYRKYFSFAEINEVKSLKRTIEQKAHRAGVSDTEVKTGRGGIRDIEFAVQFLQLLNGGDLPGVRQRNTLTALAALESAGCLTDQEYHILTDAYRFLRKTEHRLQLLFDLQTHRLPEKPDELRKLARRMGYAEHRANRVARGTASPPRPRRLLDDAPPGPLETRSLLVDPLDTFLHDYHEKTRLNRTILDHLLHQTFAADTERAEPETDLILDPNPDEETLQTVLGRYPFRDVAGAYANLSQLAREAVPFLSARRCRHFLASIAPRLLRAVAATPDPDAALTNLEKVTASLGAKAVLYELFSFNEPTLRLYVDLCATSPFLSGLLINNPGMIDELLDSLVLNQPRTLTELQEELSELLRGAADPDPILHSFRDKELLRIGVRDILGKANVRETTAALSDLAEAILGAVVALQHQAAVERFGEPRLVDGAPCRFVVVALGKLGGREMSYHSDLDLVLLYEGEGQTRSSAVGDERIEAIDNHHAFTDLAQRVIRGLSQLGPRGRLYAVDMRLRPTGKSGSLVIPLPEFVRYFAGGGAQVWEHQALSRARVVAGDPAFAAEAVKAVAAATYDTPRQVDLADEVRVMRERLQVGAGPRSLKRAPGGIVDVEFLVQLLLLRHGRDIPELRSPNVWEALDALRRVQLLTPGEYAELTGSYTFLRFVESRLRLVTDRATNELPEDADELEKLAKRLGYEAAGGEPASAWFQAAREHHARRTQELFERIIGRERGPIITPSPSS